MRLLELLGQAVQVPSSGLKLHQVKCTFPDVVMIQILGLPGRQMVNF